jgi:hypothetical protein
MFADHFPTRSGVSMSDDRSRLRADPLNALSYRNIGAVGEPAQERTTQAAPTISEPQAGVEFGTVGIQGGGERAYRNRSEILA